MVNGATKYREFKYMNKSKLLASTMLVSAAALMAAGGANAASLKLGGFSEFWAGVGDPNKRADTTNNVQNNYDVKMDHEIYFLAEETLDNGIKVGARFEMESGNGNDAAGGAQGVTDFDETFGWVKTKFGQVNLGNNDLATGYVGGISTVGPVGVIKSDAGDWIPGIAGFLNNTDVDLGLGDSQNITYFSPRVAGVQLIASYTPDSSDGASSDYDDQETTGLNNGFSGAVTYRGKFGKVGIQAGAGLTHAKVASGAGNGGGQFGADPSATVDGHTAKLGVEFGPVEITGAYAKENLATRNDVHYGGSVLFSFSKMDTVSLGWGHGERQNLGVGVKDLESNVITAGYERKVGKGISFAASAFWADEDQSTGSAAEGVGVVGGFRLSY
jgi:hypothetical protein